MNRNNHERRRKQNVIVSKTMTTSEIKQRIKDLGRTLYCDENVLKNAPMGLSEGLEFFKVEKYISDNELDEEYKNRGLLPATLEDMIKYDTLNREKMDEMMHVGTHRKDADGNRCFAAFSRWHGERHVRVYRVDSGWGDYWWFAGVRKYSAKSLNTYPSSDSLPLTLEQRVERIEKWIHNVKDQLL